MQIKVWTANPQQFVEDEDDDTFSYSVRISAQDLLLVKTNIEACCLKIIDWNLLKCLIKAEFF